MADESTQSTDVAPTTDWWPCMCGDHHQGKPRHVAALTGAGLVMHGPRYMPAQEACDE